MMEILSALEQTGVSTWVRESPSMFAYTGLITLHAIGLSFAVGLSWAIGLRVMGVASVIPLEAMDRLFTVVWLGFWLCAVSGVLLAIGSATTDLTSPIFFTKLGLIAIAAVSTRALKARMQTRPSRLLAGCVVVLWMAAIAAGRINEYPSLLGLGPPR